VTANGSPVGNAPIWGSFVDHAVWQWRPTPSGTTNAEGRWTGSLPVTPGTYQFILASGVDGEQVLSEWVTVHVPPESFNAEASIGQPIYTPGQVVTAIATMQANGGPVQVPTWGAVWHESGEVISIVSGSRIARAEKRCRSSSPSMRNRAGMGWVWPRGGGKPTALFLCLRWSQVGEEHDPCSITRS
jgi:hypothetical protein